MPGSNPVSTALRDLADDVIFHGTNLAQGAFDLVCLVALGACFYAASLEGAALPMQPRPVQANAAQQETAPLERPASCAALSETVLHGCITAQVLQSPVGT